MHCVLCGARDDDALFLLTPGPAAALARWGHPAATPGRPAHKRCLWECGLFPFPADDRPADVAARAGAAFVDRVRALADAAAASAPGGGAPLLRALCRAVSAGLGGGRRRGGAVDPAARRRAWLARHWIATRYCAPRPTPADADADGDSDGADADALASPTLSAAASAFDDAPASPVDLTALLSVLGLPRDRIAAAVHLARFWDGAPVVDEALTAPPAVAVAVDVDALARARSHWPRGAPDGGWGSVSHRVWERRPAAAARDRIDDVFRRVLDAVRRLRPPRYRLRAVAGVPVVYAPAAAVPATAAACADRCWPA